jgi:hypothetical protein
MEPPMTANEAANRIKLLGWERDEAETREATTADAAVGYLTRAEAAERGRDDYADQIANLLPAVNREAVEQRARAETAEARVAELEAALVKAANRLGWCAGLIRSDDGRDKASGWAWEALAAIDNAKEAGNE